MKYAEWQQAKNTKKTERADFTSAYRQESRRDGNEEELLRLI